MELEYRLYYDNLGKVITYTTEKLPGDNFVIITKEQFAEARPDIIVKDKKVIYTHLKKQIFKLVKSDTGIKTSKYDINILTDDIEHSFWTTTVNDIT